MHEHDARPIARGRLGKPVKFGYKAQVLDNDDGVVLDHNLEQGNSPDAQQLVPAVERVRRRTGRKPRTVTADRGHGEKSVKDDLRQAGVSYIVIPRQGQTRQGPTGRGTKAGVPQDDQTGSQGRISSRKRGTAWDRTCLNGIRGARIWTGQAVLAHNLAKIGTLAG